MRFRRTAAVMSIVALAAAGCGGDDDGGSDGASGVADPSECPVGVLMPDRTGRVIPGFSPPARAIAAMTSP